MKQNHAAILAPLVGLRVNEIGRAADMLWVDFGQEATWLDHKGRERKTGTWGLHVQTSWRLRNAQRTWLGTKDLYAYWSNGSDFDWQLDGESRFDRIARVVNRSLKLRSWVVEQVNCDGVGGFVMSLSGSNYLDVMPDVSTNYPVCEVWRLFQPRGEGAHHVVTTLGRVGHSGQGDGG